MWPPTFTPLWRSAGATMRFTGVMSAGSCSGFHKESTTSLSFACTVVAMPASLGLSIAAIEATGSTAENLGETLSDILDDHIAW